MTARTLIKSLLINVLAVKSREGDPVVRERVGGSRLGVTTRDGVTTRVRPPRPGSVRGRKLP
jgi:hypothetical protein